MGQPTFFFPARIFQSLSWTPPWGIVNQCLPALGVACVIPIVVIPLCAGGCGAVEERQVYSRIDPSAFGQWSAGGFPTAFFWWDESFFMAITCVREGVSAQISTRLHPSWFELSCLSNYRPAFLGLETAHLVILFPNIISVFCSKCWQFSFEPIVMASKKISAISRGSAAMGGGSVKWIFLAGFYVFAVWLSLWFEVGGGVAM